MYKEELANKYRGYHHYPMKIDLGKLKLPTLAYRRSRGDMIEL
jgi:hypothetical protein